MVTAEAQRTLVKSPPELWSQLSDPGALADHLGELGEIRIVRADPEEVVEWEAPDAHGRVELKPSGWGTTVTLSMTLDRSANVPARPEFEPVLGPKPEPEPDAGLEPEAEAQPELAIKATDEPAPLHAPALDDVRSGFIARLRQRWARGRAAEPDPAEPSEQESGQPANAMAARARVPREMPTTTTPPPTVATTAEPATVTGIAQLALEGEQGAEPKAQAANPAYADHATALLTALLDKLGEAHHRPFSRS